MIPGVLSRERLPLAITCCAVGAGLRTALASAHPGIVSFASMTSNGTCASCGLELLVGAKFCRRCGAPSGLVAGSSVTEAETRLFQATDNRQAQTQYHDPMPTGPSYLAPNEAGFLHPSATAGLEPARVKRHGILWASAILVVLLMMFAGALALRWSRTSSAPPPATKIDVPPPTGIAPPVVPQPPQPPAVAKANTSALIYPGAEITMEMTRGTEGSVRTLRTKDPIEKVIAWYTEKLKPENVARTEGAVVLNGSKATAVISNDEGETNVVLKEGVDR